MVESIFRKLLTEVGILTEDAKCNMMGEICNFANLVLIIKVVRVSTIPRQAINTLVNRITNEYSYAFLKAKQCITNAIDNPNG